MGLLSKILRATTFAAGIIILVFFLNSFGLNFFPDALFSELGFILLSVFLTFEILFDEPYTEEGS